MCNDAFTVGVVIPVRNGGQYIGRAIESVITQRPSPIDVIVVDGGSSDDSVSVARAFPGIKVVAQEGVGLAAARNQGLRQVSGNLVAFCDSDDRWSSDALAVRLTAFERHPMTMAVTGRIILEELEGTLPTAAQQLRLGQSFRGFTPGALLAQRKVFELVGDFDEGLMIGADSDWFVRLQQSSVPWCEINATVLHKSARGDSLSSNVAHYRRDLLTVARRFVHRRKDSGR